MRACGGRDGVVGIRLETLTVHDGGDGAIAVEGGVGGGGFGMKVVRQGVR